MRPLVIGGGPDSLELHRSALGAGAWEVDVTRLSRVDLGFPLPWANVTNESPGPPGSPGAWPVEEVTPPPITARPPVTLRQITRPRKSEFVAGLVSASRPRASTPELLVLVAEKLNDASVPG